MKNQGLRIARLEETVLPDGHGHGQSRSLEDIRKWREGHKEAVARWEPLLKWSNSMSKAK